MLAWTRIVVMKVEKSNILDIFERRSVFADRMAMEREREEPWWLRDCWPE